MHPSKSYSKRLGVLAWTTTSGLKNSGNCQLDKCVLNSLYCSLHVFERCKPTLGPHSLPPPPPSPLFSQVKLFPPLNEEFLCVVNDELPSLITISS